MALPVLADAKSYLRIQTSAEDALVTQLLARAQAAVETYIGVRITAAADSMVDHTEDALRAYGQVQALQAVRYPFATAGLAVTDQNGAAVDPTTYTVDGRAGRIRANPGVSFDNGPYTIAGTVGLSAHPDYASRLEALVSAAMLDLVADLYQRRNPGATSEAEAGVSVTYGGYDLPARVKAYLTFRVSPF